MGVANWEAGGVAVGGRGQASLFWGSRGRVVHAAPRCIQTPFHPLPSNPASPPHPPSPPPQGLYSEMKIDHPSRIQATTLPMILQPDQNGQYRDLIAQARAKGGPAGTAASWACVDAAVAAPPCAVCGPCLGTSWLVAGVREARFGTPRWPARPHATLHPAMAPLPGPQRQRQDHVLRAGHAEPVSTPGCAIALPLPPLGSTLDGQRSSEAHLPAHAPLVPPRSPPVPTPPTPRQRGPLAGGAPGAVHVPNARAGAAEPPRAAAHGQVHGHKGAQ